MKFVKKTFAILLSALTLFLVFPSVVAKNHPPRLLAEMETPSP